MLMATAENQIAEAGAPDLNPSNGTAITAITMPTVRKNFISHCKD